MNARRGFMTALRLAILFLFLTYVWPTPYRYDRIGQNPVRENRFTGEIDFMTLQGWTPQLQRFYR